MARGHLGDVVRSDRHSQTDAEVSQRAWCDSGRDHPDIHNEAGASRERRDGGRDRFAHERDASGQVRVAGRVDQAPDEASLRLLSAIAGTLFVGATMWAAREIGGPRAVVPAGVVAALAPMHVYYSQEARPYALLLLFLVLALGLVHRAVVRDRVRDWVLVGLVATLVLYTHYLGILALAGTVGMLLVAPSRRVLTRWVTALGVAGLLFVPWIIWSFVLVSHSLAGLGWIAEAWARTPRGAVARSLELFVIGPQAGLLPITLKQFDTLVYPDVLRWLALAAAELRTALLVDPTDERALADAYVAALNLLPAERRVRMRHMRLRVAAHDVYRWAGSTLGMLAGDSHSVSYVGGA